jgi:hypothetical protein
MIRTALLILINLLSICSFAQNDSLKNVSANRRNKMIMEQKIRKLHDGVLLIRLQTKENSIRELSAKGQNEMAEKIKHDQAVYNKEIIKVVRKYFNFCPVYFFTSSYSKYILSNHPDSVVFVDDSLQEDPQIRISNKNYLTAEFSPVKADTAKYYSDYYVDYTKDGAVRKKEYYGSPELNFMSFRIMSEYFVQLRKPFPYFVKIPGDNLLKERFIKPVKKMNSKLAEYYRLVAGNGVGE